MEVSSLLSLLQSYGTTNTASAAKTGGAIGKQDAANMAAGLFADLDTDNSTGLTLEEFSAVQKVMQSRMETAGVSSGGMSPPELSDEQLGEMFTVADTDGNGELSEAEFTAFDEKMRTRGPGGPPPPPADSSSTDDSLDITEIIKQILEELAAQSDTDNNGQLSESENYALAERLQSMLQAVTYGDNGGESYGMEATSGSLLNCMC